MPRLKRIALYITLLLLGGGLLTPLVSYATLTLDSTSITTDDTLKLKGGNVGVGNITPTSNLHVSGTITVTATSTLSGAATISGALTLSNPSTNSIIYTSATGVVTALASSTAGKLLTATGTAPYFSWESAAAGGITSLNGLTAATQTFTNDSNITITSASASHTIGWSGVLPISRGGTNTSTALTSGSILFSDGTAITQKNANLFWDNTNNRLAIGNTSPSTTLHVTGTSTFDGASFSSKVGIGGITNPSSNLHVSGTLTFTDGNQGASKSLYSDASGGATWQTPSSSLKTLTKITTAVTVVNTVTDTNLINYSVPASSHGTDKMVRAVLIGDWKQNSAASRAFPIFSVKVGSAPTTVLVTGNGATDVADSAVRYAWRLEVEWMALGATNSQWVNLRGYIGWRGAGSASAASAFTTGEGSYTGVGGNAAAGNGAIIEGGAASALDTTSAQALIVSVILPNADANLDLVMKYASVAVIE